MAFLAGLFGPKSPLDGVRRAIARSAWSEALGRATTIDSANLPAAERDELERLLSQAGDALALLNLNEAEACLRAGDRPRALEHLQLALEHGRSEALRQQAVVLATPPVAAPPDQSSCTGGCCPPAGVARPDPADVDAAFDHRTRLELLLASYPEPWQRRYLSLSEQMIAVVLAAHEEPAATALPRFDAVPEAERDELYWFERGVLLAHGGERPAAIRDLQCALRLAPEHALAREMLVDLLLEAGDDAAAQACLDSRESHSLPTGFRAARLGLLALRRDGADAALPLFVQAVGEGCRDASLLTLLARLLEEQGDLPRADGYLQLLPQSGGCGGGSANLPLAEFRLRHRRELKAVLESFRTLARHDPQNPYWALRLGQTYLALNRPGEGRPLLEAFLAASADAELLAQARNALAQLDTAT